MGRGNVSVSGPHEGLYYIDNGDIHVYRRDDPFNDEVETRLMGELSYAELTGSEWLYDEVGTAEEEADVLDWFMRGFTRLFPSFQRPQREVWLKNGPWGDCTRKVILENGLYYIAIEDNEWSLAVELLQKEDPYDNHLTGLQSRYFKKYLEGVKTCLLERLPSIGVWTGPWTSRAIRAGETG